MRVCAGTRSMMVYTPAWSGLPFRTTVWIPPTPELPVPGLPTCGNCILWEQVVLRLHRRQHCLRGYEQPVDHQETYESAPLCKPVVLPSANVLSLRRPPPARSSLHA